MRRRLEQRQKPRRATLQERRLTYASRKGAMEGVSCRGKLLRLARVLEECSPCFPFALLFREFPLST